MWSKKVNSIAVANCDKPRKQVFLLYLGKFFPKMFECKLSFNNRTEILPPSKMTFFEELYVDYKIEDLPSLNGKRLQLTVHPKQDIVLQNLEISFARTFKDSERIFCNGFQSWSESREFELKESLPSLMTLATPFMGNYGDYHFKQIQRGRGYLHSWTYSYIRQSEGILLVGSLSEQTAFTLIQYDTKNGQVSIQKDIENLALTHSYHLMDVVILEGDERAVFDQYFDLMNLTLPTQKPAVGWTSWYNHYTNISEEIILQNLATFQEKHQDNKAVFDTIFQIDDGYQTKIGDWLSIKPAFPNGMRKIAQEIHKEGYLAGIWLAPFVCEKSSELFQRNPSWILKDKHGKAVRAGYNPAWSGHFYVLDFYHEEVQQYLTKVFLTVLEKWGYDMVKLDFLYAVCILPRPNKTRGQVMNDAMQFLRNLVGQKRILGCGVPLGSCFGLVDYCRIGADIHLQWEHNFLKFLGNRERVSTILALRSAVGRWHLNNRAFINDPDVFLLRKENNQLTPTQQNTIFVVNALLGDLVFTSDDLSTYKEEQVCEFKELYDLIDCDIKKVEMLEKDVYKIVFKKSQNIWEAIANFRSESYSYPVQNDRLVVNSYESIILQKNISNS